MFPDSAVARKLAELSANPLDAAGFKRILKLGRKNFGCQTPVITVVIYPVEVMDLERTVSVPLTKVRQLPNPLR
jgi:hypothetical protein